MSDIRLVLPQPPLEYSQNYENLRNREIERIVNRKLGPTDVGAYFGIPFIAMKGTNATWPMPTGAAFTKIPFDTVVKDTAADMNFDTVLDVLNTDIEMDLLAFIRLRHPVGAGGASTFDVSIAGFVNNVQSSTYTQTIVNKETYDVIVNTIAINVPALANFDIRGSHTHNQPVNFDLTRSSWDMFRLSKHPKVD